MRDNDISDIITVAFLAETSITHLFRQGKIFHYCKCSDWIYVQQ